MGKWRDLIARFLPWYDPARERMRDARTDRIVRKAEVALLRGKQSERIIAEYQAAEKAAGKAGQVLIDEVRRADDQ